MMAKQYYIAYGSNLNIKQMKDRCHSAIYVGPAKLAGYRLIFQGVASIEPDNGSTAPVGIWIIDRASEASLDRYEDFPRSYRKEILQFQMGNEKLRGICYIKNDYRQALPKDEYYEKIKIGYGDFGLGR
ncbi:MAG: gamma-glutamylcyclotransferase [Christensenellaceae bacterium]|jgi:hypothetical protein|nr:gamma-glutamylcyclotransferase [Christensenellaceae bacterium]